MYSFLKLSSDERQQVFAASVRKLEMNEAVIEKDFFVVLMLDILFNKSKFGKHFAFKGGTSLSKSFNVINRFSEDIDLILDWRVLGYGYNEPWLERTKKGQIRFNKEAREKAAVWIEGHLIPELYLQLEQLQLDGFTLYCDPEEPRTINVKYPMTYEDDSILSEIKLEIEPMSAWTPNSMISIKSYVEEAYPQLFDGNDIVISTVDAKRTFWEKATILHKEDFALLVFSLANGKVSPTISPFTPPSKVKQTAHSS